MDGDRHTVIDRYDLNEYCIKYDSDYYFPSLTVKLNK